MAHVRRIRMSKNRFAFESHEEYGTVCQEEYGTVCQKTFFSSSDLQLSFVLVSYKGSIFFLIIFSSIFGF